MIKANLIEEIEIELELLEKVVLEIKQYQKVIDSCNLVIQNYKSAFKIDESWEKVKLGEIFENVTDICSPIDLDILLNYIGLENIESNTGYLVGEIVTDSRQILSTKFKFRKEDILYGKLRPYLNIVYHSTMEGICSTDILVLRATTPNLCTYFYACLFRSIEFNQKVLSGISGAQLPRVSFDHIVTLEIPLPSFEHQQNYATQLQSEMQAVEECQQLKTQMENKIKEVIDSLWETHTSI